MPEAMRMNRRQILAGAFAASILPGMPGPKAAIAAVGELARGCCPVRLTGTPAARTASLEDLADGNEQAQAIASKSSMISQAWEGLLETARQIDDGTLRAATLGLLKYPAPTYQSQSPSPDDKEQVRQELLAAGLIPDTTTIDGIFPKVSDASKPAQPVWAAPGGAYGGHHSYPGGLAMHEWVCAGVAESIRSLYGRAYRVTMDAGIVLAAPLWHDIHKTVVMQWRPDGSELAEQIIADTGAHHTISGAEAIVRGMPAELVVATLSAHNAATSVRETVSAPPILTGYQRLVNYIRAAAIIARVDPVVTGLLRVTDSGFVLNQDPPHFEGFLNHFADQDYVLTGDVATRMTEILRTIAADYGIDVGGQPARFNLFRNLVFSQVSDMRLYGALLNEGLDSVHGVIAAGVDLSQLSR
jgi:hypothetical protein